MIRRLTDTIRSIPSAVRSSLAEWFYVLTTPIRALRPRFWLRQLFGGFMEVLSMLRLVRPRVLGPELVGGSREAAGLFGSIARGIISAGVGFFWFLLWLPWFLVRFTYHAPFYAWYFLRSRTRWQLVGLVVAAVITLTATGGVGAYWFYERRREFRLTFFERQLDGYLFENNYEKAEECLIALVKDQPGDPRQARRLEMLRKQEAGLSEPDLLRFLMRYHMLHGRPAESVREAKKLLAVAPGDWEARTYVAKEALARGDRAAAKAAIADLPKAEAAAEAQMLPPNVARDSAYLFRFLGEEARYDDVVDFIAVNILPDLRSKEMVNMTIPHKLFLIDCYYLSLSRLDQRPKLLIKYWASLELAFKSIIDDPSTTTATLVEIGQAGQRENLKWLRAFQEKRLLSADESVTMARETLDLQARLWDRVRARDPKLPAGYVGTAELAYMVGSPAIAEQAIAQGIKECGLVPDLVIAAGKLLRLVDPQRGLAFLERSVPDDKMTVTMCQVYDEVAEQAGRRDKAIDACRRALKLDPKQDWARLREAEHQLKLGRPADAVAALKPIEAGLVRYPLGCAGYVRALCETGHDEEADAFLARVKAANPPAELFLKTSERLQAAGRFAEAVAWADALLAKDPRNVSAWVLKADNLRFEADRGSGGWDADLVREAVEAYRAVLRLDPERPVGDRAANQVAWLQLKVLRQPDQAFESATRLRGLEERADIKPEYLETLGAAYIGVHQFDQAVKVLEKAAKLGGPRPGFLIHLALAHHGLGHPEQAEKYLQEAAKANKSPQEEADLREAGRVVHAR
jgi:tetratricopeptide (TPR) repeat protein